MEPIKVGDVAQITAEATGLSKNTVKPICSEGAVTGGSFGSPAKRYGTTRIRIVRDDFDRAAIRRTVHEFYTRKEYQTLLQAVHQKDIFLGGKRSLKQLLKEMRFKKTHDSRKYVIIYLDETWFNAHHSLTKCWIDSDGLPVK